MRRYLTVFADASFCHRTKAFGWAAWAKHGRPGQTVRLHGSGYAETSSAAELQALHLAAEELCRMSVVRGSTVVLQSDCTSAIASSGALVSFLIEQGAADAYTKHVRAHQGGADRRSAINEWCDAVAKREMRALRGATQGRRKHGHHGHYTR